MNTGTPVINPEKDSTVWLLALGGAALAGIAYLALRRDDEVVTITPELPPCAAGMTRTALGTCVPPGGGLTPIPAEPVPQPPQPPPGPGEPYLPPPPAEPEPEPEEPPGPPPAVEPGPVNWQIVSLQDVDLAEYPWEQPYLANFPTPGMCYRVISGNNLEWLVRNAVGSLLVMAGRAELVGAMNPNNPEYLSQWANRLRAQMRAALTCGWWHDILYGQDDPVKAGGVFGIGPNGRGLNWLPVHANQVGRLGAGLPARRTTTIKGNRFGTVPANEADDHMTLFIPAPDLEALKSLPREQLNLLFTLQWSNGIYTINPPPMILDHGVVDSIFSADEAGCPGWNQ